MMISENMDRVRNTMHISSVRRFTIGAIRKRGCIRGLRYHIHKRAFLTTCAVTLCTHRGVWYHLRLILNNRSDYFSRKQHEYESSHKAIHYFIVSYCTEPPVVIPNSTCFTLTVHQILRDVQDSLAVQ